MKPQLDKSELDSLSNMVITLQLDGVIIEGIRLALITTAHSDYFASAQYWVEHIDKLRDNNFVIAIPFASFMSLMAAVLAGNYQPIAPWLRRQLDLVAAAIAELAPTAAGHVSQVASDL